MRTAYLMEFEWDTESGRGSKVHLMEFYVDHSQARPGLTLCSEAMPDLMDCEVGQPESVRCKKCRAIATRLGKDIEPGLLGFDPNLLEI